MISEGNTMMSSPPPMSLELGCVKSKDVITSDGRNVGTLSGAWMDTNTWTVTSLIVDLNKIVLDELSLKKPLLRTAKVTIPTSMIKNFSDVAQLNADFATLSTIITNTPL